MKKLSLLIAILCACVMAQAQSSGFSARKGGNCFTLEVPEYMTKTFSLNDVATLQYQNTSKSSYAIVIEDDKDHLQEVGMKFTGPKDFLESFATEFKQDKANRTLTPTTEFKSNGYAHAQTELFWTEDDTPFYMMITGVETAGHFYKIMCWTTLENKPRVEADFRRISKSLKE